MIRVSNLTFYYDGSYEDVFRDVSFELDTKWKLGLIGRNGRGKTTLLKLLQRQMEYLGTISANVEFDYFPYEIKDKTKTTIEIVEEIFPDYEFWELCREWSYLKGAEDVWYRPFETLSNGEQTKVQLAVLFLRQNHFLLIDEPTNHLDMDAREAVCNYLNRKTGFILVSHDRSFLDGCIDHVLAINKNNLEVAQGNFSTWWENKCRRDAFELAENEKRKKEIRRLSASAEQAKSWADAVERTKIGKKAMKNGQKIAERAYIGEKSKRMQQRRKNLESRREKELEEKSKLLKNVESKEELRVIPAEHHKEILLSAENLSLFYGERQVCREISFTVRAGDCLALAGANGSGKSSVLAAVLQAAGYAAPSGTQNGRELCIQGKLECAPGLIVSYVPQDTAFLKGSLEALIAEEKIDGTLFLQFLRKLDFSRSDFDRPMEYYSAGQRKKVLLARSLCQRAHVYIWDEPLNYIDLFSRMQLEELIVKCRPALMLVEHDRTFVENTGAHIVRLREGSV